ncbi:hypothetical protein ACJX0J_010397, partial [Zea mays]
AKDPEDNDAQVQMLDKTGVHVRGPKHFVDLLSCYNKIKLKALLGNNDMGGLIEKRTNLLHKATVCANYGVREQTKKGVITKINNAGKHSTFLNYNGRMHFLNIIITGT